jgi:hypothetical protein
LKDPRLDPAQLEVGFEGVEQASNATGLEDGVGVQRQNRPGGDPGGTEVDRGGEADVPRQRQVRHAPALQQGHRAVGGAVVDDEELDLLTLAGKRVEAGRQEALGVPAGDHDGDGSGLFHGLQPDSCAGVPQPIRQVACSDEHD